jgi:hypothetical protein
MSVFRRYAGTVHTRVKTQAVGNLRIIYKLHIRYKTSERGGGEIMVNRKKERIFPFMA